MGSMKVGRKLLIIELDEEELAEVLMFHAPDWESTLSFLENLAIENEIEFSPDTVANIIRAEYEKE